MSDDPTSPPALAASAHWHPMARLWDLLGPPLRLSPEDVAGYRDFAWDWIERNGAPRLLLLGVTPEIYGIPWPDGHHLLAADTSLSMIEHIWPGAREEALHADWLALNLPSASRDIVLTDGGLNQLQFPAGHKQLASLLHRIIPSGGRFIFRLFTPPAEPETADHVLGELLSGRIANLNVLKLRLGAAMQDSPESGIAVRAIWEKLRGITPDWESLALRLGWRLDHLKAIDAYRDSEARYYFMGRQQVVDLFCSDGKYAPLEWRCGNYLLGERCPITALQRL